jgi:hypothetical protein
MVREDHGAKSPEPPLSSFSPVTDAIRKVFHRAKRLSPMQLLSRHNELFRPRSELTQDEVTSPDFTRRRARAIEMYMASWWTYEVCASIFSCFAPWPMWVVAFLLLPIALRLVEILQVTVNATIFDALTGRPDEIVASRARTVVLSAINFLEIAAIFGAVYALNSRYLHGSGRPISGFYFSITTQLTIRYGDIYPTGRLRIVAVVQGLTSMLFVVLVFGRFMASLPQIKGLFGERKP